MANDNIEIMREMSEKGISLIFRQLIETVFNDKLTDKEKVKSIQHLMEAVFVIPERPKNE